MKISSDSLWKHIDWELRTSFIDSLNHCDAQSLNLFLITRERLELMVKNLDNDVLKKTW